MKPLRVATRKSRLAMAQAAMAVSAMESNSDVVCELIGITTQGDMIQDRSLSAIGGDGVFTKELQTALLDRRADVAVHSMKDLPTDLPATLRSGAVLERGAAADVLLSRGNRYTSIEALPRAGTVGTSSLRRASQLRSVRDDLQIRDLRGNVDTRVRRLLDGEYDAIVLALAGMQRIGLLPRVGGGSPLHVGAMVPAVGQGAIFLQFREDDETARHAVRPLNHPPTEFAVSVERAFLKAVGGGCAVPVGCHVAMADGGWHLSAFLGLGDGSKVLRRAVRGEGADVSCAMAQVRGLAAEMLAAGGREMLAGMATPRGLRA